MGDYSCPEVAPMSKSSRSIEKFLKEIDEEVAKLPPGSDVAGFITRKHTELGEMLAQRVTHKREAASKEAGFSPSALPSLPAPDDEAGQDAAPEDGSSSRR
jgi:hypothetical protein